MIRRGTFSQLSPLGEEFEPFRPQALILAKIKWPEWFISYQQGCD